MTRYYNIEANNNNNNNNGSMMGGGVKEMSKPMKLGQPIDGRLGISLKDSLSNIHESLANQTLKCFQAEQ